MKSSKNILTYAVISIAAAVVLSFLPFFYGIGWPWTIIMSCIAVWVFFNRDNPRSVAVLVATATSFAIALQRLNVDLISLLWIATAVLFGINYWQQHREQIQIKKIWLSENKFLVVGIATCLFSLLLSWSIVSNSGPGMMLTSPNYQLNPGTGNLDIANNYLLFPGMNGASVIKGIHMQLALCMAIILLGIFHIRISRVHFLHQRFVILVAVVVLVGWWIWSIGLHMVTTFNVRLGPLLFLLGLLAVIYAEFFQDTQNGHEKTAI